MKIILSSIVIAALFMGLVGCGKSAAQKERDAARQKFKEAIAAVKVRTQGSTYSEFRKAELDLKTSFEANKSYLEDVRTEFGELSEFMSACDHCWDFNVRHPILSLAPDRKSDLEAMLVFNPRIKDKLHFNMDQRDNDPDFSAAGYVKLGLTKINASCETILESLNKKN